MSYRSVSIAPFCRSIGQKAWNVSERVNGRASRNTGLYKWEALPPFDAIQHLNDLSNMAAKTTNQQTTTFMKPFPGAHQSHSLGRDPSPAKPPPPLQPRPDEVPKPNPKPK
ncbi:hypothetical protein M407DRAFT_19837 [Tulasnella calospora MUT 4182]|uniref:Uncharacterized protein n=1 Tax=Tulasnella calospora MUT 4182 TaxID=1051891 RepID=A0A0C3QSZ6_9AGAM|nr:hypothetical protein M407DRAFT_19837 [Tulasnella calospora MUT 4182]